MEIYVSKGRVQHGVRQTSHHLYHCAMYLLPKAIDVSLLASMQSKGKCIQGM